MRRMMRRQYFCEQRLASLRMHRMTRLRGPFMTLRTEERSCACSARCARCLVVALKAARPDQCILCGVREFSPFLCRWRQLPPRGRRLGSAPSVTLLPAAVEDDGPRVLEAQAALASARGSIAVARPVVNQRAVVCYPHGARRREDPPTGHGERRARLPHGACGGVRRPETRTRARRNARILGRAARTGFA